MYKFNNVSLLITHYNRSSSLERLLKKFEDLNCQFGEIIVSDDCSKPEHQTKINDLKSTYDFKYITSETNKGLGNNINKGQKEVSLDYILYVQEDFVPTSLFPEKLVESLQLMQTKNELDMIRYYAYGKYPHLSPFNDDFSTMDFAFSSGGYKKFYLYSDHPHLKRSSFPQKFGYYKEGHDPEQTEYRMMMSFLQKKGHALFYNDFQSLFEHKNSSDEPSTMTRVNWRRSKNGLITIVRNIYRSVKFNVDYLFMKV